MAVRVGINGFGRIGRNVFKALYGEYGDEIAVVAANDLGDVDTMAHLLKYDSVYGRFGARHGGAVPIERSEQGIVIGEHELRILAERDPARLPWGELGVDIVIESTGFFTDAAKAQAHLAGGAKKVIITAPAKGEDITVCMGVNEDKYDPARHHIVSNASGTTNCLAPVAKVVLEQFGVVKGLMTTVHSYTAGQRLLDNKHADKRRGRTSGLNIVPTTTGAARAVALVIPELQGKFDGFALRVPTPTVSIIDFVAQVEKRTTAEAINAAFQAQAAGDLEGILGYSEEPLVSSDYREDSRSSIVDGLSTMVIGGDLIKVIAWYDNEWGYSCRVADLAAFMAERGFND
jgi:glyceraldehyde 3-phosphate dehydrogenase